MRIATVIIPCGPRHLHLLPRAIHSARAQTVPVNVLWYIDTERKGPGYGRNHLAAQVETPFIVMLDADDYLLPDFVETCLTHWRPGTYVYSNWYQGNSHIAAVRCYEPMWLKEEGRSSFHLPPSLFPTALYHAIGGHDESLWGAEDTDFFWKAHAQGIISVHIEQALFVYTDAGYRSVEAANDPAWQDLIQSIYERYRRAFMGCCDKVGMVVSQSAPDEKREGDILARYQSKSSQKVWGKASGRYYGRLSRRKLVWIDPLDLRYGFEEAIDPVALTEHILPDIQEAETTEEKVRLAGVRASYNPDVPYGFDMQQHPEEIAAFIDWCAERGLTKWLEIGTGESAGLARFLVDVMGFTVTSIDTDAPKSKPEGEWTFIQGDSREVTVDGDFDVLFIDGNHDYDFALSDYDRFSDQAAVVAFHDISPNGFYADSIAKLWRDMAYWRGELKKGYHETLSEGSFLGIGWVDQTNVSRKWTAD